MSKPKTVNRPEDNVPRGWVGNWTEFQRLGSDGVLVRVKFLRGSGTWGVYQGGKLVCKRTTRDAAAVTGRHLLRLALPTPEASR